MFETLSFKRDLDVGHYFSISMHRELSFFPKLSIKLPKKQKTNSPDHFFYNAADNQAWTLGFMYFFSFSSRKGTKRNKFVLVSSRISLSPLGHKNKKALQCYSQNEVVKLKLQASVFKKISQYQQMCNNY